MTPVMRTTVMERRRHAFTHCLLLCGLLVSALAASAEEKKTTPAKMVFDWVKIEGVFYLEIKNVGKATFTLDDVFVEGFNVTIEGLDEGQKKIYETPFRMDLDRAPPTFIKIEPGRYHRKGFRIEHSPKVMPKKTRFIRIHWNSNESGTKLPEGGLRTSIYDLRQKLPGKPEISARWKNARNVEDFQLLRQYYLQSGITGKEVLETLGKPISEYQAEDGVRHWLYVRIDAKKQQFYSWSCEIGTDGRLLRWRKKGMR